MTIRFRSRHLLATFFNQFTTAVSELGWVNAPVNFGATGVSVIDFQPEERNLTIKHNTVAISLGDYQADVDEELGTAVDLDNGGGLRSGLYSIYVDVYMEEQALVQALCDDVRDIYTDLTMPLVDQITGAPVYGTDIVVESVVGPGRPAGNAGSDVFRKHWRVMRIDGRLYFQS